MGCTFEAECRDCGHEFRGHRGGGFFFHLLRCDTCGEDKGLSFDAIGEPHLRYLKGGGKGDGGKGDIHECHEVSAQILPPKQLVAS